MSISASDVKKLRDMTGAGMMDAKKALTESEGDFDAAVKYLREKGLADSKKRADKEANQGTIGDYIHYQQDRAVSGVLVELACETDFVAKSEEFKDAAKQIAMHIAAMKPTYLNIEDISEEKLQEEKDIISKQSENEGKPAEVIEKIIEGRIVSFYKDNVLNEQIFCNPEIYEGKVSTMIEEMSGKLGEKIYIKQFSRVEVGS
ncbi:MAG: translation elongation factor Ts [Actinobacteria bacterium]|jgi:elongation factor Ts|nr:translation elongation factor Ts [Actinomycetota bacterium]MBL6832899.1 translation elongation factor Ts [Candidatus Actinomarina sp.]